MKFTLQQELNKEFLLSKYSEETYMTYYLGIPVKKGLYKNPLRRDNKVTCSFYKRQELIFHDFATGKHYNFISVVMEKFQVDYYTAIHIIATDFGLIEGQHKKAVKIPDKIEKFTSSGPSVIGVRIKDFTEKELQWWKTFGITLDILNYYNVFSCKNVFLNNSLFTSDSTLTFGYYGGKKDDLELWRIYYSQKKEYRFLTNWPATKLQGYDQLPEKGKLLVITKSMKDCMCLYSMGINAVAPNSENLFVPNSILNQFKQRFKYIVVFYDNDLPGIHNLCKIKKKHKELIYFWIPRSSGAKDISDYHKMYGHNKTISFIKENIIKYKNGKTLGT